MRISKYNDLIVSLPVKEQTCTTNRETWIKYENEYPFFKRLNSRLFNKRASLSLTRQDVFDSTISISKFIVTVIHWGYTKGMRGNNFGGVLENFKDLTKILERLKKKKSISSEEFSDVIKDFERIPGVGLSTYSKFIYFLGVKIDSHQTIILDRKIIENLNRTKLVEFQNFENLSNYNSEEYYLPYVIKASELSTSLGTKSENIEQFLFLFGHNLRK